MNNDCSLADRTCEPCRGGTPPMTAQEAETMLAELNGGWLINEAGHLEHAFVFPDFMGALHFANQVGAVAEEAGHHPDLFVAWGKCGVEIWTHKIAGLAEADFILAAKTSRIYETLP
ncbi:MAG: 4a-hydroxytetrahydrobiopterin dehydratase [Deltaproteobacteria bacterium]|nr:4a-hydroxytetrahydrobiopterin dehydratase [Deltaproteobacteria bacterium]